MVLVALATLGDQSKRYFLPAPNPRCYSLQLDSNEDNHVSIRLCAPAADIFGCADNDPWFGKS